MKMKLDDTCLKTDTAFLPYLEKGKKLYQERNILYQTPKSVKKNHQMSSTVNQSLPQRTRRRLFNRNESLGTNKHTETTLLHFSVDDSLHLEITGNYKTLFHHLHWQDIFYLVYSVAGAGSYAEQLRLRLAVFDVGRNF